MADQSSSSFLNDLDSAKVTLCNLWTFHWICLKEIVPLITQSLWCTDDFLQNESFVMLICGDHGMSDQGSHGGASDSEVLVPAVFLSPTYTHKGMQSIIELALGKSYSMPQCILWFWCDSTHACNKIKHVMANCLDLLLTKTDIANTCSYM